MNIALSFLIVLGLIGVSALCSGLNIALMALEPRDLERKAELGNRHARRILPFRRNTHLTLSAILLTNVAAVSTTSLVLESVFFGVVAGIITTLLIVVFGEILPQALFLRNALRVSAYLTPALKTMVILTYPVAKPLQLMLDRLLKEQAVSLHTRRELGLLITEHLGAEESELDEDEVEIIRGALQLSEKRVRDIMTPISKVYWLRPDSVIDGKLIDEIKAKGRSRIPIFNADKSVCYGVLLVKQLVDMDFDEEPRPVDEFSLYQTKPVGNMTALDTMFRKFIAARTHLMPVERDDKIVGIVTIEDLIEEIVGHEIEDEMDRGLRT